MLKSMLSARNKKGFTLMEMLIVVAIIAVLVAIAIPTFTAQLEKSREATDAANLRAAIAEVSVQYLSDNTVATETVAAVQTTAGWQNTAITNIGGFTGDSAIAAKISGASWTVTYDTATNKVTVS